MPRGIIMSISGKEAVILTPDSEFVKVALPAGEYDLGQEIEAESNISPVQKWLAYGSRRWAMVAAVLLIAIVLPIITTTVFLNNEVYAYVTLDINPSTEFTINGKERIIRAKPLNEEGAAVLEGSSLKGKDIQLGIEYFVERACQLGFASAEGEGAVLATTVIEKESANGLEEKITAAIDKTVEENGLNAKTGVLSATKEIKEEADKAGVSAGEYLIALQASDDQIEVDIEDVKKSSIVSAISKAGGDLESIIKRARKTNEELVKLLEKNRDKLRKSSDRDKDDNEGNTGSSDRDDSGGRDNSNGQDNNNGPDRSSSRENSDRNSNGRDSDDRQDKRSSDDRRNDRDKSRDNNRKDDNRKHNNGHKDNERDKKDKKDDKGSDSRNRRGGDNAGNRDNRETKDRDKGDGKADLDKRDRFDSKNRKKGPEALGGILKRMLKK